MIGLYKKRRKDFRNTNHNSIKKILCTNKPNKNIYETNNTTLSVSLGDKTSASVPFFCCFFCEDYVAGFKHCHSQQKFW